MRAAVIKNGVVINLIEVDSLDFMPGLVAAPTADIGDLWNGTAFTKPAPVVAVPQTVTRRQALQALLLRGLLANVQPAIDAIADATQRGLMQIEWDDSQEFQRHRASLIQLGTALGLTSADLDDLFVFAATL